MKRVFMTRHFSRWMRNIGLTEAALCKAVVEMEQGLIDAVLGGGVVKKRVAIWMPWPGQAHYRRYAYDSQDSREEPHSEGGA